MLSRENIMPNSLKKYDILPIPYVSAKTLYSKITHKIKVSYVDNANVVYLLIKFKKNLLAAIKYNIDTCVVQIGRNKYVHVQYPTSNYNYIFPERERGLGVDLT